MSQPPFSPPARDRGLPMLGSQLESAPLVNGGHNDFIKGSIMAVRLKNFMIHKHFVFRPSARLNVVIGPSGSGKSAILAALCVCLAGKPDDLGRGCQFGDFVRKGQPHAEIEVDLVRKVVPGSDGSEPEVICSTISCRLGRKCTNSAESYAVDGKSVTRKELAARLEKINIRLNSMCQFLPQERIGKFSQMNPRELLAESLKSIGDGHMFETHDEIVKLDDELAIASQSYEALKTRQERLSKDLEILAPVMERAARREQMREQLGLMKAKRPRLELMEKTKVYAAVGEMYEEKKRAHKDAQAKLLPLKEKVTDAEASNDDIQNRYEKVDASIRKAQSDKRTVDEGWRRTRDDRLETEREVAQKIASARRREEELRAAQNELRAAKLNYEKACESTGGEDPDMNKRRIAEVTRKIREVEEFNENVDRERTELAHQMRDKGAEISHVKRATAVTDDYASRMLNNMNSVGGGMAAAAAAYQSVNRLPPGTLRGPVFGPIAAHVKPKSAHAALALENVSNDFVRGAFVVTCPEDAATLRSLKGRGGFAAVKGIIEVSEVERTPVPPEEAAFAAKVARPDCGWLLDMIDAPPEVKRAISNEAGLNNVFVVGDERPERYVSIAPTRVRVVTRSRMFSKKIGRMSGETMTFAQPLKEVKVFTVTPTSGTDEKRRAAEARVVALEAELAALEQRERALKEKRDSRHDELTRLKAEKSSLLGQNNKLTDAKKRLGKAEANLVLLETSDEDKTDALRARVWDIFRSQTKKLKKKIEGSEKWAMESRASVLLKVEERVVSAMLTASREELREAETQMKTVRREYEEASNAMKRAHEDKRRAEAAVKAMKVTPEMEARFAELDDDLKMLDSAISEAEHGLRLLAAEDTGEEAKYEEKKLELERVEHDLAMQSGTHTELQNKLSSKYDNWRKLLDREIFTMDAAFRKSMTQFECEGQLVLDCTNDDGSRKRPREFGLLIKISFRKGGPQRVLSGSSHSGGERALTTMCFILCMQELTPCPFRIVDEINQGMDSINERLLFKQFMKTCGVASNVTTRDGHMIGRQYFVISPKLLPELEYAPCCRVHIVNSGAFAFLKDGSLHPEDVMKKRPRSVVEAKPSVPVTVKAQKTALPPGPQGSSPESSAPVIGVTGGAGGPVKRPIRASQVVVTLDGDDTEDEA